MNTTIPSTVSDVAEAAARFTEAAAQAEPGLLTACRGWTAHDLLTHVVAGGAEISRLVDAHLRGQPVPPTASFAEREAPARALSYGTLLEFLGAGGLVELLSRVPPGDSVPFTGWSMDASTLSMHVHSELVVHRWDLVGSDDSSIAMLSRPELTSHAVRSLTHFDVIDERASARTRRAFGDVRRDLQVRLRVDDEPDVVVEIRDGRTDLRLESAGDGPGVRTDAATRLLWLWGRRPDGRRATTDLDPADLAMLDHWMFG